MLYEHGTSQQNAEECAEIAQNRWQAGRSRKSSRQDERDSCRDETSRRVRLHAGITGRDRAQRGRIECPPGDSHHAQRDRYRTKDGGDPLRGDVRSFSGTGHWRDRAPAVWPRLPRALTSGQTAKK